VSGGPAAVRFVIHLIGEDPKRFIIHDAPITTDKNYIGVAKIRPDAEEIIRRLNPALASMWADGTISKIVATYE
ncbi:MAG TPA: hypothetical protein VN809_10465, partial [Telmatospirillum sp.]|nr:hypothetical protein [Telmatospirillum sp.]